jgi:hypothetical protein
MPLKNCCPALRMFSKSLIKHFKCFDSRLTELHAKPDADMLLTFATHHRQKKHEVKKALV